ncbi:DUF5723 family protein [Polaribacter sp.]|nr:DUF5723 family protein [Polaribacter sp.]
MKKIFFLLILFVSLNTVTQNKQILYGFAENPQTLLLNPGAETNYKFHVGIPFLSGLSGDVGLKNFKLTDLFSEDGIDFNTKFFRLLNKLDANDHLKLNLQMDVLNAGFRVDAKTYISFGFYQELDVIGYWPKDVITFLNEGNASYLNRSFDLSQIVFKADFVGALHVGVSRKINSKLTLGGRFKIYSSTLNLETQNNSGTLTSQRGSNNIYTHYLNTIDMNFLSAGLVENDEFLENPLELITNSFLGGSLGVGLDFGMTYHFSPRLEFTGSIIDFGYINYSKKVQNTTVKGSYTFEGVNFVFDATNPTNYWEILNVDFEEKVPRENNTNSYTSWRPTRVNAALKYSFGNEMRSKYCYDNTFKEFYTDAFGLQIHTIIRPLRPQYAITGFYKRTFTEKLHAKVTYTLDDYSFHNVGAGISTQIGNVSLFGMVDNLFALNNLANSSSVSFQMGLNLIFD